MVHQLHRHRAEQGAGEAAVAAGADHDLAAAVAGGEVSDAGGRVADQQEMQEMGLNPNQQALLAHTVGRSETSRSTDSA